MTRRFIIWVGLAVVLIGLGCSWRIGRSITLPLEGLAGAMKRLADGDTSASIPAKDSHDEIGAMARTVVVFRDNMIERERLAGVQSETNAAREQRGEAIGAMIRHFRSSVEQALDRLREAAGRLESASSGLNIAADSVSSEARDGREQRRHRLRQCHDGGEFDRGACGLDRRHRRPSDEIDRCRAPRGRRNRGAP